MFGLGLRGPGSTGQQAVWIQVQFLREPVGTVRMLADHLLITRSQKYPAVDDTRCFTNDVCRHRPSP
jgi:hypothetical protein